MNFTIIDAPQRSDAWRQARLGRLTASRAADMLASLKSGGESASRRNLRVQLVLERLTGRPQDSDYISPAMQQGIDREPDAYARYEALTGSVLSRTGFLSCDTLQAGCSLDGHVGAFEGIIEIKCPTAAIHLESLKTGMVPAEYAKQITHALWITGAQWCDWLSYQPDFPEPLQVKLVRLQRDDRAIAEYDAQARRFLQEVDAELDVIHRLMASAPATGSV